MTISEAARLLGVSRQALYARIKREPELSSELSTVDGVRHISETGLQRLKEAISEPQPVNTLTETLTATFTSTLTAEREAHRAEVERLHQEIDRLHADLETERKHSRELDDIKLPPLDTVTMLDGILCDELTGEPVELLPNVIPAPPPAEGVTLSYLHAFLDCCDISEEAKQDAHERAGELLELHRKQSRRNARRDARCKDFDSGRYNDILRGYIVLTAKAAGMDPEPLLDALPRVLDTYTAREALQAQ